MPPAKLNIFKYGMPLYGAAWPTGDIIFVVGGGGHGIKNRLVFARYRDGVLSDQIGEYNFGEDCPTRLAVSPDGRHLIVSISAGGLRGFELDSTTPALCPDVVPIQGSIASALACVKGEVKVLQFNGTGDLLAVGCDDGSLSVFSWPAVEEQFSLSGDARLKDAVRDIDFSPGHGDAVASIVCQNGTCEVWELREKRCLCKLQMQKGMYQNERVLLLSTPTVVAQLLLKPELERPSFSKCRWSRDGSNLLYTLINNPKGAHVAAWEVGTDGPVTMKLRQHTMLSKQAGTAFAISPNGALLALGTSEGDVVVCTHRLRPVRRASKVHMVFTTDMAFSEASDAVLSVSADAGAHVLEVQPGRKKRQPRSGGCCSWLFQMLLVLLFLFGALAAMSYLLEQQPVRDLLPPELLTHADKAKGFAQHHVVTSVRKGQEWWESEEAQQLREKVQAQVQEWVEKAKPVLSQLLQNLNGGRSQQDAGNQAPDVVEMRGGGEGVGAEAAE